MSRDYHDRFFKYSMSDKEVARSFFAYLLPESVSELIDLDSLASWILFVSCLKASIFLFAISSSFLKDYSGDAF